MLRRTIGPLACDEAAADVIHELLDSIARRRHLAPEGGSAVRARLLKLLPAGGHGTVDTSLIAPADGWAARMVPCLVTLNEGTAEVTVLLRLDAGTLLGTAVLPGTRRASVRGTCMACKPLSLPLTSPTTGSRNDGRRRE